ncbi:Riorf46 protein [Moritella viscosa]|nr:Riorf46 protein [Moritella viscosa]
MLLTMTDIEIYRINTIKNVIDKRISGVDAAALLNLSTRQVYRLTKQYLKHGTEGLISHKRGQPSNHHHSYKFKQHVLDLFKSIIKILVQLSHTKNLPNYMLSQLALKRCVNG